MNNSFILNSYLILSKLIPGLAEGISFYRKIKGIEDPNRIRERFGVSSFDRPLGNLVWLHAASIGETMLVLYLMEKFSDTYQDIHFLITTNTLSSGKFVSSKLPENVIHQYLPYDLVNGINSFLNHWKPSVGIIVESEFWPALISETKQHEIPLILVNGKISQKSFLRWKRFPKLANELLNKFDCLLIQSAETKSRFVELGVKEEKLVITGQLKQESKPLSCNYEELENLVEFYQGKQIWVAASTHVGEEEIIAEAQRQLLKRLGKNIQLIIVPRHPERGKKISELFDKYGLNSALRSEGKLPGKEDSVYIADTIGELGLWYRLAKACFVGGSLTKVGGHNPYEPALLGCPIIHGKYFENFSEVYERLSELGGAQMVATSEELSYAVEKVLNPHFHAEFVKKAKMLEQGDGKAVKKTLEVIESFLN